MNKKVALYVRVSTKEQTYEQQIEPCLHFCKMKGWTEVDIFKEVESSTKVRPKFEEMLRRSRSGYYNNIVLWRLDRGWRRSNQFIMDIESLRSKGVSVCSVVEGFDPTTAMGKCMMTILIALAELERTNISEATKQRLDIVRKHKHVGRPFGSKDKGKRSSFGYQKRWYKQKGGKIEDEVLPDVVNLDLQSK